MYDTDARANHRVPSQTLKVGRARALELAVLQQGVAPPTAPPPTRHNARRPRRGAGAASRTGGAPAAAFE